MPFVLQIAVDPSSTRGAQGTGTNKDYEASFDENLDNDVVIGRITNLDPGVTAIRFRASQPGGGNDNGRYKIIGDAVNGWFIVVNTGGSVNFDREKKPSHNVYIEALNGTNVVGEGDYIVRMRDLNEAATDINFTGAATNLQAGSTGAGTQVVVAAAVDPDTTNAAFRDNDYRFANGTLVDGAYTIDAQTGRITTNRALTAADVGSKTLSVVAYDATTNSLTYTEAYTFTVGGASNTAPTGITLSNSAVLESARGGDVIGTLSATDAQGGAMTYAILNDLDNKFAIVNGQLVVRANASFNFEGKASHDVRIQVTDSGGLTFDTVLTITVDNVNEAPRAWLNTVNNNQVTIQENQPINFQVAQLVADDPDGNHPQWAGPFSYRIDTNDDQTPYASLYDIVNNGGIWRLVVKGQIDYDALPAGQKLHMIKIITTDNAGAEGSQYVTINLTNDTSDDAPANTRPTTPAIENNTVLELSENQGGTVNVATVHSTDDNVGGTTLQYELANTFGGLFSVNQSGVITFNGTAQDYENNSNLTVESAGTPQERKYFNVQVRAKESGTNGLASDYKVVKVYLNNVNEAPNTPAYTAGSVINENAGNGTPVGTLTATDPDGTVPSFIFVDSGSTVSADGAFRIVLVNNVYQVQVADQTKIQVTSGSTRTFTYAVKSTDGTLQSTNNGTVTITVNDVVQGNDPPVISGAATPITRTTSDKANIQAFTGVTIQDAGNLEVVVTMDSPTKGKFVTNNGNGVYDESAGTFTIRGDASFVTNVLQALQFDARDKAAGSPAELTTFTIKVTDNGGAGLVTTNNNINVSATAPDLTPENQPPRDIVVLNGGTIQELANAGAVAATLGAQDPDDTGGFVYSIVNPDGRFAISGNTIVVANGVMLDFEQKTSHVVRVRVTDKSGTGRSYEKDIAINVSDVNPETMTPASASPLNDIIKGSKTGNFKDTFFGGAGDDKLWGGYGNDTLWGGAGKDVFVFDGKLGTASTDRRVNFDTIKDYSVKDDSIWLDNDLFKSNKKLYASIKKGNENAPLKMASKFFTVGDKAKQADDYFVYDAKKRVLYYDADGSGSKAAIEMASFTNNKALKAFTVKELFFI